MKEVKEQKQNNGAVMTRPTEGVAPTWNPWSEMAEIRRRMDDLFGSPFAYTPLARLLPAEAEIPEPVVDIHETEEAVEVFASLPGYTIDQIDVQATENTFTIQGQRKALFEGDKARTHRDTGLTGSSEFYFTYTLPAAIDTKKIEATFTNGVLTLKLPKTEDTRLRNVPVKIKAV